MCQLCQKWIDIWVLLLYWCVYVCVSVCMRISVVRCTLQNVYVGQRPKRPKRTICVCKIEYTNVTTTAIITPTTIITPKARTRKKRCQSVKYPKCSENNNNYNNENSNSIQLQGISASAAIKTSYTMQYFFRYTHTSSLIRIYTASFRSSQVLPDTS